MHRILVVEDETDMLKGLQENLQYEGYNVETAEDGRTGLQKIINESFDAVILDVMLPELSGFDVCRQAREKGIRIPIIMLTARGEEIDKVLGLELGADDYMTKPFGLRELLARVKAALRRAEGASGAATERLTIGSFEVDFAAYTASRNGKPVAMTTREIDVLRFLWQNRNKTVKREDLLKSVWLYDDSITSRTVDNFIMRLRHKIEDDPAHPSIILTIHGIGYKLAL
jgi:DNA-binding response OmpR family regulator